MFLADIRSAWVTIVTLYCELDAHTGYWTTAPLEAGRVRTAVKRRVFTWLTTVFDLQIHAPFIRVTLVQGTSVAVVTEVVLVVTGTVLANQLTGVDGADVTIVAIDLLTAALITCRDSEILTPFAFLTEVVGARFTVLTVDRVEVTLRSLRIA